MYNNVLLAIDLNDEASWRKALPAAAGFCQASGGVLHATTVIPDVGMSIVSGYFPENFEKEMGEKALQSLRAFCAENAPDGIAVRHIVRMGNIYQSILRAADEVGADLIVMAAHRPELSDYLLGPNAARVVRHAKTSVLVVR